MRAFLITLALAGAVALATACSSSPSSTTSSPAEDAGGGALTDASEPTPLGGDRPTTLHVPSGYVPGTAAPIVVVLHGYGASGAVQDLYFGLTAASDARGFLLAAPDGRIDTTGKRYWNATDACCDFGATGVDDSTYLSSLIEEIKARYTVDPKRVFLVGHSNGGFMSYRMACDHSDQIAAIASLAGAMYSDVSRCQARSPVSVLQIHGTADKTVAYAGGLFAGQAFPSAAVSVSSWASIDGCTATADTSGPRLDLDAQLAGTDTTTTRYGTGCKPGGHAELWTIEGGSHIPSLSATFTTQVLDFLFAHPKP